jgi:PhzF family phenazine biosynthesis protein
MSIPIYVVDAFTAEPFKGNPAGVCLLPEAHDVDWMQNVAKEMKHAETAFLVKRSDGWDLRWFTPAVEVNLCGHATLASAHILYQQGHAAKSDQLRFFTRSGELNAECSGDWITLNFPTQPAEPVSPPSALLEGLKLSPLYVGRDADDYLVLLENEKAVRELQPDFGKLRMLGVRGVIVTAASETPGVDFVSRFFAPGAGIDEDPVTGSAHCCLGPFWKERLHKSEFLAHQLSERGGVLKVKVAGDRILLSGQAVTVLQGTLNSD